MERTRTGALLHAFIRFKETAETFREYSVGMALLEEGNILGDDEGVSLGRYQEAAQLYERCYRMAADLARQDAGDAESRLRVTGRGIQLANVLRHSDPRQALAIYDEVLARS